MLRVMLLLLLICLSSGCSRLRFVIDAVPAEEDLTETTVMEDGRGGFSLGGPDKIALMDVSGVIFDARRPGLATRGENPLARFTESLRRAEKDNRVKAVIVRINSPGGSVTASDVMYRELSHFKGHTGKPVVILMADVAASGGYYLACAGDEIIAHPTTITGSIGVVMQTFNFSEGMRRIGIRADAIVSGPNKPVGSPFEPMPAEHRALLQGIVNEFHENFLAVVKQNRPQLSEDKLLDITDGSIVTGARAAELGLIDSLGDLHDAFDSAKRRANLTRARLVKYHRPLEHVGSAYAQASAASTASSQINLLQLNVDASFLTEQVGFYYLWDPRVW